VAVMMHEWANRWIVDRDRQPLVLIHKPCGQRLDSRMICSECRGTLRPEDVAYDREACRSPDRAAGERS